MTASHRRPPGWLLICGLGFILLAGVPDASAHGAPGQPPEVEPFDVPDSPLQESQSPRRPGRPRPIPYNVPDSPVHEPQEEMDPAPPRDLRPPARAGREPARVALVVGINQYHNRGFDGKDLRYATRDAQELGQVLGEIGFAVRPLIGDRATKANIKAAITAVTTNRRSTDLVVIALAGHGAQLPRRDSRGNYLRDARGKLMEDIYFCPVDAVANDRRTFLNLHDELLNVLEDRGGINLLWVDACRDVPGEEPAPAGHRAFNGNVMNGRIPGNTALMFSCSAGQKALETPRAGGGHGVFFHHVIEGLRGQAADAQGEVSWDSLAMYLRRNVNVRAMEWCPREANALEPDQFLQSPHRLENLQRDVVFYAIPVIEAPGEILPNEGDIGEAGTEPEPPDAPDGPPVESGFPEDEVIPVDPAMEGDAQAPTVDPFPAEPEAPSDPDAPADPEVPSDDPGDPVDPEAPSDDPGVPADPGAPADPEAPNDDPEAPEPPDAPSVIDPEME